MSHVSRPPAKVCIVLVLVWSIVLGALSWSRPALAADTDPAPQYHCLRNNLLISSYLPCDYGMQTPDLINRFRLVPGLGADGGLYDATTAQQGALERFQLQAYDDVLKAHGLPASDLPVVKSWARSEATAHLWSLITEAIKTDPSARTEDQQLVVDWSSDLLHRQAVATAEQSALEYARWAGIDPVPLNAAMGAPEGPNAGTLTDLLSAYPANYSSHGGFCNYAPPAPFTNYVGDKHVTCVTPCPSLFGCPPPTPTFDEFTAWGSARVNEPLLNNPSFLRLARDVIGGLSFISAAAALSGLALALFVVPSVTALATALSSTVIYMALNAILLPVNAFVIANFSAVSAAAPAFAASVVSSVAAAVLGSVLFVILAIVVAVIEGIKVAQNAEVPGKLAQLIVDAHAHEPDMTAVADDPNAMTGLFSLLLGATLPEPLMRTCDNAGTINIGATVPEQCLNPTPVAASRSSDAWFAVTAEGSDDVTLGPTISTARRQMTTTSMSRPSGNWWVNQVSDSFGNTLTVQSLVHYFTDWNGVDTAAWITRTEADKHYFVISATTSADGAAINPGTCVDDGTCTVVESIRYVGPDGKRYTARLIPPPGDTTPLRLEFAQIASPTTSTVDWVNFAFSEPTTGKPWVSLTRDGVPVAQPPALFVVPADGVRWMMPVSGAHLEGRYVYTVHLGDIRDRDGFPVFAGDQSISWYHDARPTAAFDPVPSPNLGGVRDISVVFSEPVDDLSVTDFKLTRDGAEIPTFGLYLTSTGNRYMLGGLRPWTGSATATEPHEYELSVRGGSVHDRSGNPVPSTSVQFVVDYPPIVRFDPIAPTRELGTVIARFSEPVGGFDGTQLFMSRDGGVQRPANEIVILESATPGEYTLHGLRRFAREDGHYTLTFAPSGANTTRVTGSNGQVMTSITSIDFVIDSTGPDIAISAPTGELTVPLGGEAIAAFSCSDRNGVAACLGTTRNDRQLPTDVAGVHQFTVIAVDTVGNQTTASVSYEVTDSSTTTTVPATTTTTTSTTAPDTSTTTSTTVPSTTVPSTTVPSTTTAPTSPTSTTTTTSSTTVPTSTTVPPPITPAPMEDFVPVSPARVLDSRPEADTVDGAMVGGGHAHVGSVVELHIAGRAGIPSDAVAVALNLTVTETTGAGYAVAYPCGATPHASTLNFSGPHDTASNAAVTQLDANGNVCLAVFGASSQLVVDVFGYFPAGTRYRPNSPQRILDTRPSDVRQPGTTLELDVAGEGVPPDAAAVVLNLTATQTEGPGYVVAYPCGTTPPEASSLNYTGAGQTVPNLIVAPVALNGTVCLSVSGAATHLVADLSGHLPGGTTFRVVGPARLADTRPTPVMGGETIEIQVAGRAGVNASATTAVVNVTALNASGGAFVTVYPCDQPRPNASSINIAPGRIQANAVFAKIDRSGKICAYVGGAGTDLIVDINGTFNAIDPSGIRVVDPAIWWR